MDAASSPPTAVARPNPDVVSRRLGDEAVLVHLGTNRIFELNVTGARIWELLCDACPPERISTALAAEFHIDELTAREDVRRLVGELGAAGLLTS